MKWQDKLKKDSPIIELYYYWIKNIKFKQLCYDIQQNIIQFVSEK